VKVHILVITPGFPKNENDTDCIPPMQEYFKTLISKYSSLKISVISIHYPYKKNSYDWNGIKIYSCGGRRVSQPIRLFYWARAVYYSLKINRKNKIDIIHSFWLNEAALVGNIVNIILKIKHVNTLMGQDAGIKNRYIGFLSLKKIIKIAVSEFQSEVFQKSSGQNVNLVINWGIDDIKIQNNLRTYDIIGVGALISLKNYMLFVEIVSELAKEFQNIKCLLIGDGSERTRIESIIKEFGLINNIALTGHIKREEVLNKMQQSKILLHTSEYESFGYVIAEALSIGCFVVSRKTGCADQCEKIKIAENKTEFVRVISTLLKMNPNYLPYRPFKMEDTVNKYYKLYNDLILVNK
jgi:1,2-diacylglycerol 3-alpha-glucosyltransferase